jgi:hypothetical protein
MIGDRIALFLVAMKSPFEAQFLFFGALDSGAIRVLT